MLMQQTCNTYGEYTAIKDTEAAGNATRQQGNAEINIWCCCPGNDQTGTCAGNGCIRID